MSLHTRNETSKPKENPYQDQETLALEEAAEALDPVSLFSSPLELDPYDLSSEFIETAHQTIDCLTHHLWPNRPDHYCGCLEDLRQELWVHLLQQVPSYAQFKFSWKTFVRATVMRKWQRILRDHTRTKRPSSIPISVEQHGEDGLEESSFAQSLSCTPPQFTDVLKADLRRAAATLSQNFQKMLALLLVYEHDEVQAILELPERTYFRRYQRLLEDLRQSIGLCGSRSEQ